MNRAARRAAAAKGQYASQPRAEENRRKHSARSTGPGGYLSYLEVGLRPLRAADMVPGYDYEPGTSVMTATMPATREHIGRIYNVPVWLPPAFRASTSENARLAYLLVMKTDPEAGDVIKQMARDARPINETQACVGLPKQSLGHFFQLRKAPQNSRFAEMAPASGARN